MTGVEHGGGAPLGPPWPVEVLADLHAGALDDAVAAELWPLVREDPPSRAVLAALDATLADLGSLAALPPPRMPADLAARLDDALAREAGAPAHHRPVTQLPGHRPAQHQPGRAGAQHAGPPPAAPPTGQPPIPQPSAAQPSTGQPPTAQPSTGQPPTARPPMASVTNLADARKRRNRLVGWGSGVVVAAAAAVGILFAVLPSSTTPGQSVAQPPIGATAPDTGAGATAPGGGSGAGPVALTSGKLNAGTISQATGKSDYGALTDPRRRSGCLSANGQNPNLKPVGAEQVTLDGKPGTLLVLTTGQLAQYRLLVVGPDCAAGDADTLANQVVGGISGLPVPPPTR